MCGHDQQVGEALFEGNDPQHVLAVALGIRVGSPSCHPGPLLAFSNSFELPYEVAYECVALSVLKRDEDDDAARGVTRCRHHYDRAVSVHVVAGGKPKIRAPFEPILLVSNARERLAKLPFSSLTDELVFLRRDPNGHPWKVRQTADM